MVKFTIINNSTSQSQVLLQNTRLSHLNKEFKSLIKLWFHIITIVLETFGHYMSWSSITSKSVYDLDCFFSQFLLVIFQARKCWPPTCGNVFKKIQNISSFINNFWLRILFVVSYPPFGRITKFSSFKFILSCLKLKIK